MVRTAVPGAAPALVAQPRPCAGVCDADEMTQLTRQENVFVLDISDSPEGDHRFTHERMQAIDAALT